MAGEGLSHTPQAEFREVGRQLRSAAPEKFSSPLSGRWGGRAPQEPVAVGAGPGSQVDFRPGLWACVALFGGRQAWLGG